MWTENDLGTLLERIDPVPEEEALEVDRERMWSSLEARRAPAAATPAPRLRVTRRAALVAAAITVLLAAPAAAVFLDQDIPPLDRIFGAGEEPMVVYGSAEGLPEGCAHTMAFRATGEPVVAGLCGVFELDGDRWVQIAGEEAVGRSVTKIVVTADGTVWLGSSDQPIRRLTADGFEEAEVTSPWLAAGVDGSLWAIDYRRIADHDEQQTLAVYSDGEWRHVQTSENAHGVVTARDGSVWVAVDSSAGSLARVVGDELEHVDVVFGGIDHLVAAPDGSVWMAGGDGELIERQGVTDIEVDLLRYDGSTVSAITVPFPEISALAIAPDGTVWAASYLYGVFSYDATKWDQYDLTNGMPEARVEFLEVGPDGSVYAGTSIGVVHIRPAT
jgi:ligand-binding sensor domain-containing protein